MAQQDPPIHSAEPAQARAAGGLSGGNSPPFADLRTEIVRQRKVVEGIRQGSVLQMTPISNFLDQQEKLQRDALADPQWHEGRYTTVGFEHEFVQMIKGQPLSGLSHLLLAHSGRRMPYTGIPFVLETDASDAVELVSPPFLLRTVLDRPVPLPDVVRKVDDMFRERLQHLAATQQTIGDLVQAFEEDGIDFKLGDLKIESEHMSDETPAEIVGKKKKDQVDPKTVEAIKLKKSTKGAKGAKGDEEESHVSTHVNFATDAETFGLMEEFFSGSHKAGTENYLNVENEIKAHLFQMAFAAELGGQEGKPIPEAENILAAVYGVSNLINEINGYVRIQVGTRWVERLNNVRTSFDRDTGRLRELIGKGILSPQELQIMRASFKANVGKTAKWLQEVNSRIGQDHVLKGMEGKLLKLNSILAEADLSFEKMPIAGAKSPQLRNFLSLMARTLSGMLAVPAMEARRKAQIARFKKGKDMDDTSMKRHLASVVKDVKEVWIKDTLMNIGIGVLTHQNWAEVLRIVSDKGLLTKLQGIATPNVFRDQGMSEKEFPKMLKSALAQIRKDIKGQKLHQPSKKQRMAPFIGPAKQPELFSHNPKFIGARQDTYIPQHPDPRRNKVQMPGIWDQRLHVVESRAEHIERLEKLQAHYLFAGPKKKEERGAELDFLKFEWREDMQGMDLGSSSEEHSGPKKQGGDLGQEEEQLAFPAGLQAANALSVFNVVNQTHDELNPEHALAEGVVAPMLDQEEGASKGVAVKSKTTKKAKKPKKKSSAPSKTKKKGEGTLEYIRDMRRRNPSLQQWLTGQSIGVATNYGDGLNCLIISLLQHATGGYQSQHAQLARHYRRRLIGQFGAQVDGVMLYSDDDAFVALVGWINHDFHISMNVYLIQVDEHSRPYLVPHVNTGANPVVIWDQGGHYEALYWTGQ